MRNHSQRGFTLIELVVVVALFAILSMVVVSMFISENRLYKVQTSELIVASDARSSLDDIDAYVKSANRVLGTYSTYTSGATTLILQIQSVNASNQLIPGTFDNVVFYLSSDALYRQVFPNASSVRTAITKQLAGNVSSLTFTYNNADFTQVTDVTTSITVLNTNPTQNRSITVSTKSFLRDY